MENKIEKTIKEAIKLGYVPVFYDVTSTSDQSSKLTVLGKKMVRMELNMMVIWFYEKFAIYVWANPYKDQEFMGYTWDYRQKKPLLFNTVIKRDNPDEALKDALRESLKIINS